MDKGLERGFKSDIEGTNGRVSHCATCDDGREGHDNLSLSLGHLQSSKEVDYDVSWESNKIRCEKEKTTFSRENLGNISLHIEQDQGTQCPDVGLVGFLLICCYFDFSSNSFQDKKSL